MIRTRTDLFHVEHPPKNVLTRPEKYALTPPRESFFREKTLRKTRKNAVPEDFLKIIVDTGKGVIHRGVVPGMAPGAKRKENDEQGGEAVVPETSGCDARIRAGRPSGGAPFVAQ